MGLLSKHIYLLSNMNSFDISSMVVEGIALIFCQLSNSCLWNGERQLFPCDSGNLCFILFFCDI